MANIYIATLGQRPEAITIALDLLLPSVQFSTNVILHTDPFHSDISNAIPPLRDELTRAYPSIRQHWAEIRDADGGPLLDIDDDTSAMAYFLGISARIAEYKARQDTVHLMVAGGRKAMSIYAALAATLVLTEQDRVWTVITPHDIMQKGVFHLPPGQRQRAKLINLPFIPTRLLNARTNTTPESLGAYLERQMNRRTLLLDKLTTTQRELAELFSTYPRASDAELAVMLERSERTVNRHMSDIYAKMRACFDIDGNERHLRQILSDLLAT
jgi:DNA-binding CsgD family transcriptional regulator